MSKTPHQLQKEIEGLRDQRADAQAQADGVTVLWGAADPEHRPDGVTWVPETNTLTYDVWAAQRQTLNALDESDHDIVAFLAGYGTGKSVAGARWLIANAITHPGSRFLALGIDFAKARDTTFRILFEQLPGERTGVVTSSYNGPETSPIVVDYNRAEHRLTLVNDTVIKLGSADKWNRYAGDEYGAVWLDEPSHYGEDLHDLLEMIGSRLRGVAGPKTMLWTLTGNGYNAAWEILEKREGADGDPIGLGIEIVRASTLENPYLDDATKERFERQYAGTGREEQALHGGFAAASGLVYSGFSRDTHVVTHADAVDAVDESNDWRIYGYDAGWGDPRVLLEIAKTPTDQLVVLDEFYRTDTHVREVLRWLAAHDKPGGTIYAEHEPSDIDTFDTGDEAVPEYDPREFDVVRAEKSIDAGIADVRERLEVKDGEPGLLISDQCENLIRELLGYKEEQVGTSAAEDHCADASRYAIHTDQRTDTNTYGPSDIFGTL